MICDKVINGFEEVLVLNYFILTFIKHLESLGAVPFVLKVSFLTVFGLDIELAGELIDVGRFHLVFIGVVCEHILGEFEECTLSIEFV